MGMSAVPGKTLESRDLSGRVGVARGTSQVMGGRPELMPHQRIGSAMLTRREAIMLEKTYSITALAEEFGVTARALRFYEEKGLLSPFRQGLERIYTRRDRARLRLILRGKRFGFTLGEIRTLLALHGTEDGAERQVRLAVELGRGHLREMEQQRREMDAAIAELAATMQRLEQALLQRADAPAAGDASVRMEKPGRTAAQRADRPRNTAA